MEAAQALALILTSAGGAVIVPKVLAKVWQGITGRSAKRRRAQDEAARKLSESEAARKREGKEADLEARRAAVALDVETAHRRRLQEALSATRRVAIDHGVPVAALPPFPGRPAEEERENG